MKGHKIRQQETQDADPSLLSGDPIPSPTCPAEVSQVEFIWLLVCLHSLQLGLFTNKQGPSYSQAPGSPEYDEFMEEILEKNY